MTGLIGGDGVSRIEELEAEFEAYRETEDADDREIGDHDVRVNVAVDGVKRYRCRDCGMVRTASVYDFETSPCEPEPENEDDDADELVTDGGTRSATADTALGVGVYDEDAVGVDRAAEERGRYLERTTALDKRPAKAVALSEMGYTDSGIAKRLDATEATVADYLDRVAERYGIGATFPKTPEQRGELNATGGSR